MLNAIVGPRMFMQIRTYIDVTEEMKIKLAKYYNGRYYTLSILLTIHDKWHLRYHK